MSVKIRTLRAVRGRIVDQTFMTDGPLGDVSSISANTQVVTPNSQLERAPFGKQLGADVELQLPGKLRSFVVVQIR